MKFTEDKKEKMRKYREINRDRINKQKKEYYYNNKEELLIKAKEYYQRTKIKRKEQMKMYRELNRDKINKQKKEHYKKHRKEIIQQQKIYRQSYKIEIKKRRTENYQKVKVKIRKKSKLYYINNKDIVKDRVKTYKRNNRDKVNKRAREKYKNDPEFLLKERTRGNVKRFFRQYIKTGKIMSSKEYGIDYKSIGDYLLEQMKGEEIKKEDIPNFEVHHIKWLSTFKFVNEDGTTNLEEIKKAFAPENHKLLTIEEHKTIHAASKYL